MKSLLLSLVRLKMIGQFVVDQLRESPDCEYFDDVNEIAFEIYQVGFKFISISLNQGYAAILSK